MKLLLILASCGLCSCAGLQEASFDRAFADAVIRNNTQGVFGNCNDRNAVYPLNGVAPVYYAASYGNEDVIDLLYNHGASLHVRSPEGKSLAYAAAANGHNQTARKLVALSAGSSEDVASGAAVYQQKMAAEAESRRLQAKALAWLFTTMTSGGGSGSSDGTYQQSNSQSGPNWGKVQYEQQRAAQIQENREARQYNEPPPNPYVPSN